MTCRSGGISTLTQAVLETGGVSLDKLERKINDKISEYGSRWDAEADAPEGGRKRGLNYQWKNRVGAILDAYYKMEQCRVSQGEAEAAEKEVDDYQNRIKQKRDDRKKLLIQKDRFQKNLGLLNQEAYLNKEIKRLRAESVQLEQDAVKWPLVIKNHQQAKTLQKQQNAASVQDQYTKAKEAKDRFEEKKRVKEKAVDIKDEDLKIARDLTKKKQREEGKIAGLNLIAQIKQLGNIPINVTKAASGESLGTTDGRYHIGEAVEITVPGIMEMQLMPQGIDLDQVKDEIRRADAGIKAIYEKYEVGSVDEMQTHYNDYHKAVSELKLAEDIYTRSLNGTTWEAIKEEYDKIQFDVMPSDTIRSEIRKLCGTKSVEAYLGGVEQILRSYEEKYGTEQGLQDQIEKTKEEIRINKTKQEELDEIPEEFLGIDNPDQYEEDLENKITRFDKEINDCNNRLNEAIRKLGDRSAEEYAEELLEKEAEFNARKAEFEHWKNIHRVFMQMKEQTSGNPIEDIENSFRKYLGIITDGNIELRAIDETMTADLSSGSNKLTYDILSNGTKDTISLAFRLAMLDHLYPDGGGLAIFDDAFTEMDPKRAAQACRLIETFAEKNQVIFITCDDKYKNLMNYDNLIDAI